MFIACEHCGALLDVSAGRWFDPAPQAEAFSRTRAAAFWASKASGRFAELGALLAAYTADGPAFRAHAEEFHYLYAILYPDRVPAQDLETPVARAKHARSAAMTDAVVRFDPEISALWGELNEALRAFGKVHATPDEMVAAVRVAVERATRGVAAMQRHAETMAEYPAPAGHYAKMIVRASFTNMVAVMRDPAIYERVAIEVFGDRARGADDCTRCGGPMDAEHTRCPHCGAVVERLADDPWVATRLGTFAAALAELQRTGAADTYAAALTVLHLAGSDGGAFVQAGATRVAALLRRALPWLPAAELHKAASLFRDLLGSAAERAVLDEALAQLQPWTPDPRTRPALPAAPTTAFDPDAWLAKARTLWSYARGNPQPVAAAFSIAITDLLVALPNARPPITAALVLRFFSDALADIPRATWLAALAPLVPGYAELPAGLLLRELVATLREA